MIDQQATMHREAAALQQHLNVQAAANAATGEQTWQALAREAAPEQLAALLAARQALDEAGAHLQEMRHQHAAIRERRGPALDEALALVEANRAEEDYIKAEHAAQAAERTLSAAVAHIRDARLLDHAREYNRRTTAAQMLYQERLKELEKWAEEVGKEMQRFEREHITLLVAAGAAPLRRVQSTGLFVVE